METERRVSELALEAPGQRIRRVYLSEGRWRSPGGLLGIEGDRLVLDGDNGERIFSIPKESIQSTRKWAAQIGLVGIRLGNGHTIWLEMHSRMLEVVGSVVLVGILLPLNVGLAVWVGAGFGLGTVASIASRRPARRTETAVRHWLAQRR